MNITVPDEYIEGFVKANNTFLYQLVFDPINRKVVPLNPYPENIDPATLSYAGVYLFPWKLNYRVSLCDHCHVIYFRCIICGLSPSPLIIYFRFLNNTRF